MRKIITLLLLIISIYSFEIISSAEEGVIAEPTDCKIILNGNTIDFQAYNIDGYNYFKLRDIAMALVGTEKEVEIVSGGRFDYSLIKEEHILKFLPTYNTYYNYW